ncbi:ArpU family phage packaging/lysis transcriptional regulator [Rossellomorea sp. BNER]|uniref:ArpU family phage packaging/lysis transcriptional regulator n=1 Tax=Rossellomorea sp. BNER TaxID=2962031 RepID=UPI003AF2F4D7|nr:ArpU family transcriptional regulator [Rossellomorea sp. BNER]
MMATLNEKEIHNAVIKQLREYRALKVKLVNLKEREDIGADMLFPSFVEDSCLSELKVKQIERALHEALDSIERGIVERKYLNITELNDEEIYLELGVKRGKFYEKKKEALTTLARAMGII